MLKCLELIGFKSFADKTRFDFGAGITSIVGPNGSGKSNVVDAIRWILGEQSAKSLRGKEMADVIFNGSGTRRSLGMAEVSLTLDNRSAYLPLESDEVVITRRVYRGGEGEYLINGQLARLRDIRELFLGTGAGAGAYSIIEQGKVESMLQSSPKDRRHIFEEAAGTSRFKAKKIEALRRLDRVEQNLLRVQDIHEELEKQLRGLRAQAGKARKYKEFADRLKELRLLVGRADFFLLSRRLRELDLLIGTARETMRDREQLLTDAEIRNLRVEETLLEREEVVRQIASRTSELREKVSAVETELAADMTREADVRESMLRARQRIQEIRGRLDAERSQFQSLEVRIERESEENKARRRDLDLRASEHQVLANEIQSLRRELLELQKQSQDRFQTLARFENEQAGLDSQLAVLWEQHARLRELGASLHKRVHALHRESIELRRQESAVHSQLGRTRDSGGDMQTAHRSLLEQRTDLLRELAGLRDRRTAVASRMDVLENLRLRHEGLQGGVKQALARREKGDPAWRVVIGVLAECLTVNGEFADLVELVLGSRGQALLVETREELTEELLASARSLPGRVQFLPIRESTSDRWVLFDESLEGPTLASLVECDARIRPLVDRLLGSTFLAPDFASANAMIAGGTEIRVVTRQGDLLEADGLISTGPPRVNAGILSRAAELRELADQAADLDLQIAAREQDRDALVGRIADLESRLSRHDILQSTLLEQSRHFEIVLRHNKQRHAELEKQRVSATEELARVDRDIKQVDEGCVHVAAELLRVHEEIKTQSDRQREIESLLEASEGSSRELEAGLQAARIEAAKVDERLAATSEQRDRLAADIQSRARDVEDILAELKLDQNRADEFNRRMLASRADLAQLYRLKDLVLAEPGHDPASLQALREERRVLRDHISEHRREIDDAKNQLHASELQATELRLQRESMAARIREDYEISIESGIEEDYVPPEESELREARVEVEGLREKIVRLGSVNVSAIQDLEDLELRSSTFAYQINDLSTAKRHLEEVIGKINEESRRLFLDTFETVREHFQDLFRKLFGGGKADVLLEDDTDVLESGIEIIARPPGKEPRSISLLSGGEKTMTAVALLMALFRSKPTPFCILDEVDAALDEANISRFVASLREFLDRSQFILITHSKTTMASADVLHGVTQRESGVSIRVSVRLDDVTDDGHIVERSESAQAG